MRSRHARQRDYAAHALAAMERMVTGDDPALLRLMLRIVFISVLVITLGLNALVAMGSSARVQEERAAYLAVQSTTAERIEGSLLAGHERGKVERRIRLRVENLAALQTLRTALRTADTTLQASSGRVLDDNARTRLTEVSTGARQALGVWVPVEGLERMSAGLDRWTEEVTNQTATVHAAVVAWQAEQERIQREREEREARERARAQEESAQAARHVDGTTSAGAGGTTATATTAAEAEAARLGVAMEWGHTNGHWGAYWPGSGVISIGTEVATFSDSMQRAIVRHETAHLVIESRCSVYFPSTTEFEPVADAYADIYLGGLVWMHYGYSATQADYAARVASGTC